MNIEVESRVIRALARGIVLVLVLALFAWGVLAMWFQPNIIICVLNANESAAIAVLKNIANAQQLFRERVAVDCDGDGRGEYGWLTELAGAEPLRWDADVVRRDGAAGSLPASGPGRTIDSPLLASSFGQLHEGRVCRSGYLFDLWLPGPSGTWIRHGSSLQVDPDAAELGFRVYAWPETVEGGKRAFFVDSAGDVMANSTDPRYCGSDRAPLVDAALPSCNAGDEQGDQWRRGRDGRDWVCVQ